MSNFDYVGTVNDYTVQEFVEFLRHNGLSEFETVVIQKSIDGHTFLNLAEFEINNWKPLLNSYQSKKFWTFLNQVQQFPQKFRYREISPIVPPKPSISKEHLQKLSQNDDFLTSLRAAFQNRGTVNKKNEEGKKSFTPNQNATDNRNTALPPRPPLFKKLVAPPTNYHDSDSEEHDDSDEVIYETPDEQDSKKQNTNKFEQKTSKVLPELPPTFPKQVNLFENPDPKPKAVIEEKPQERKLFRLEQHYAKQREKEREFAQLQQSASKFPIKNSPLPPIPTPIAKEVSPKARRAVENVNTLPRPPRILPRVDIPELADVPKPAEPKPMEQESYYRYTDRKGAEELLSEPFDDGTYLVRPSRNYHGTLSVKQGDKVYHIGIKKVSGNLLEMESSGLELKFKTLNEITDYFKINPLSVRNRYNEIVDIYLGRTLPADRT